MDIITNFLKDIGLKWDFETLLEKEPCIIYEIGGFRKYKKHTFSLYEYIQSYQFTQMNYQIPWVSLNMVIKEEHNNYVLWLINNILKENDQKEIYIPDLTSEATQSSFTGYFYFNNKYQINSSIENSNLLVEIIKYK